MIGVVITTRNEAETIGQLVSALVARDFWTLVVDAESTDGTAKIAGDCGAAVCDIGRQPIGPSLAWGLQIALDSGCTRIAQMDAGGSHDPADLNRLLYAQTMHEYDLVIGSRFTAGSRYVGNPKRALLSRAAAAACNWAQPGASHSDWTSGYRLWFHHGLRMALDEGTTAAMHGWQIEMLANAGRLGLRIAEVPITYRAGRSSFNRAVAREAFGVWKRLAAQREDARRWYGAAAAR